MIFKVLKRIDRGRGCSQKVHIHIPDSSLLSNYGLTRNEGKDFHVDRSGLIGLSEQEAIGLLKCRAIAFCEHVGKGKWVVVEDFRLVRKLLANVKADRLEQRRMANIASFKLPKEFEQSRTVEPKPKPKPKLLIQGWRSAALGTATLGERRTNCFVAIMKCIFGKEITAAQGFGGRVMELLGTLNGRDAAIIEMRFGISPDSPAMSVRKVAKEFAFSWQNAFVIEQKSLRKMKLKSDYLLGKNLLCGG